MDILKVYQTIHASPGADGIHLFERPHLDTFEVYGEEAAILAGKLFKTAEIVSFGPDNTPVFSITPAQLTQLLPQLLREFRVEIWAFSAARKSWKIVAKASPGNYEQLTTYLSLNASIGEEGEEMLMDATSRNSPVLASVISRNGKVAFAYVDVALFHFGYGEFVDSSMFANTEAALIQVNATECIYPRGSDVDVGGLFDGSSPLSTSIVATPLAMAEFDGGEGGDCDLMRLLHPNRIKEDLSENALAALMGLIKYLSLMSHDYNLGMFSLDKFDLTAFMRLDETALHALNVFPLNMSMGSNNKEATLFGLLNHCKTMQGSRMLSQWMRQPLLDRVKIEERLDAVEALVNDSTCRITLRETILRGIPQVSRITRKLVRGKANLQDLVLLYTAVSKIAPIHQQLSTLATSTTSLGSTLSKLARLSGTLQKYAELIESTVDLTAIARHEYLIKASFDPALSEISHQREAILDELETIFKRVASELGLERGKKIKLERNDTYGHYLRISRLDGALIKGGFSDDDAAGSSSFVELAALKNGIYFATPAMREASLRYTELGREYASKQSALVQQMVSVAKSYKSVFEELDELIAMVDVFQSLAHAAIVAPMPFTRPKFISESESGDKTLNLSDLRHPCVEAMNPSGFIPNNVLFGHDASTLQLITGPNMGGKSTFIRAVAIAALMAQIGSFVPCSAAVLPIFDAVMVRVGAGDSILRGISTFMMEMLETASILATATPRSLVIIDELGRGTSTSEGLGIAWGVCKQLLDIGCLTLFATHFHELTGLSGVTNLHALATIHDGRLVMTFKMIEGVAQGSFGIHVAKMAGFPEVVLQMSRLIMNELESSSQPVKGNEDEDKVETLLAAWNEGNHDLVIQELCS